MTTIITGRKKVTSVRRFNDMSKMTDIVAKEAGGIESVKAVYAKYNKRIARIRQMMEIRKERKASTEDVGKLACGIIADLDDETRLP